MPQFIDSVVTSPGSADKRTLLLNVDLIAAMSETADVLAALRQAGWSEHAAREEAELCDSVVELRLRDGSAMWLFHDLDDVLLALGYLARHPTQVVVQVDDVPREAIGRRAAA